MEEVPMFRRLPLVLPAVLAAIALPVAPALAGEDGDGSNASATLHAPQGCVSGDRAKATVSGELIGSVAFYLDGKLVKTVRQADSSGEFSFTMKCARLSVGAHRAKAVVTFSEGATPASETLRFQITKSRQGTPRFAG
jgi:hypothetical protein